MKDKELITYKAEYGIVPVVTRDGRKARILCTDRKSDYPVIANVEVEDNLEIVESYTIHGALDPNFTKWGDLFLDPDAPKTTTRYQNIYRRANGHLVSGALCKTKEKADNEKRTFNGTWLCQQTVVIPKK